MPIFSSSSEFAPTVKEREVRLIETNYLTVRCMLCLAYNIKADITIKWPCDHTAIKRNTVKHYQRVQ